MIQRFQSVFENQRLHHKSTTPADLLKRMDSLLKLKKWLLSNRNAITEALYKDLKRNETETELTEIYVVLQEIKLALKNLEQWMQPVRVNASITFLGTRSSIMYQPKGICLIISPWNYPFQLAAGALVSALAAGNSVFLKPSEFTPNTSALLHQMCNALFPEVEVVVCEGDKELAQELLQLPFDHILFIGSPEVGKVVMEAAAKNLTSVTLELGGKTPVVIAEDADLADAADKISSGKFLNCGQSCVAPDYVLVHEKVRIPFIQLLIGEVKRKFGENGDAFERSANYARIVNDRNFNRLKNWIDQAVLMGAKIEMGGQMKAAENFIAPTILSDVSPGSWLMEVEIFGPVLPIIGYRKTEDILNLVKSKPKPLNMYVYSKSSSLIKTILNNTSSGTFCMNESNLQFMQTSLPFGGVGNSGWGRTHGHAGFLDFSNARSVFKQRRGITLAKFLYPPFTTTKKRMADILIRYF